MDGPEAGLYLASERWMVECGAAELSMIQIAGANSLLLREAAGRVATEFGARLVVLFGSTARGERTARDLDVGMLGASPLDAVAATNTLTRQLGTQAVDVTDLRRADPVLLALVARDGVPLYEAEPGEFSRFVSVAMRRFADTRKFRDAQRAARSADGAGRP